MHLHAHTHISASLCSRKKMFFSPRFIIKFLRERISMEKQGIFLRGTKQEVKRGSASFLPCKGRQLCPWNTSMFSWWGPFLWGHEEGDKRRKLAFGDKCLPCAVQIYFIVLQKFPYRLAFIISLNKTLKVKRKWEAYFRLQSKWMTEPEFRHRSAIFQNCTIMSGYIISK